MELTDNLNIQVFKPLMTPGELKEQYPETDMAADIVARGRKQIEDILLRKNKRRIVIAGPCSLHDRQASLEYARRLKELQLELDDQLVLVMRAYFEKPRTTLGWKGMLYDPHLDGSYDMNEGVRISRQILAEISELGLPTATEFLDPIVPQFLADLISWAAIGARTAESQIHRQMASGLSMPIGFKNATDGNLSVALDAIKAAMSPHSFLGVDRNGQIVIAETRGNKFGHLVMRGGSDGPNYSSEYVAFAEILLKKSHIHNGLIIDCSHANSRKDHRKQKDVLYNICDQITSGNDSIGGIMLESFLSEGKQSIGSPQGLKYGVSLTDSCIGWDETESLIKDFAKAVRRS